MPTWKIFTLFEPSAAWCAFINVNPRVSYRSLWVLIKHKLRSQIIYEALIIGLYLSIPVYSAVKMITHKSAAVAAHNTNYFFFFVCVAWNRTLFSRAVNKVAKIYILTCKKKSYKSTIRKLFFGHGPT